MSEIIIGQVRFLLMTSLLGMGLMGAYDVCRFLRWIIPHHKFMVAVEDILFWSIMSLPAYALFFVYNDGEIRWYGALAVFVGGILYEKGISMPIRRLGNRYLSEPKRKIMRSLHVRRKKGAEWIKKWINKIRKNQMDKKLHKKSKKSCKNLENSI